jgi:hypothetical protein
MSISHEFIRHAYRRAVWAELQRLLMDRYVVQDKPPAAEIICEEVPFAQRVVREDVLMEMLDELELLQEAERREMMQFEMKRKKNGTQAGPEKEQPAKEGDEGKDTAKPGEAGPREAVPAGSQSGPAG